MPDLQTPAPAQADATPAPISATFDAAAKGNFSAFQAAESSARAGKPLADVAATPAKAAPSDDAAADTPAERTVSKRQQQINDYERRIAEQNERIARLEGQAAPRREEPAAPTPPETKIADWDRISDMPDAPKLEDFNSVQKHTAAMSAFVFKQLSEERSAAESERQDQERLTHAQGERVEKFIKQLDDSKAADPEFVNKLTPEVRALKPFGALQPGESSGPRNVIAEQVYDSPIAPKVLLHFSQHPEALTQLETIPPHIAAMANPAARAKAHIQHMVREFAKLEGRLEANSPSPAAPLPAPSTITAAPPPPPSVSNRAGASADPSTAAVAKGDFAAFQRTEDAKRREKFGR